MRRVSTSNSLLSKLELSVSRVSVAGTLFIDQAVSGGDIQAFHLEHEISRTHDRGGDIGIGVVSHRAAAPGGQGGLGRTVVVQFDDAGNGDAVFGIGVAIHRDRVRRTPINRAAFQVVYGQVIDSTDNRYTIVSDVTYYEFMVIGEVAVR